METMIEYVRQICQEPEGHKLNESQLKIGKVPGQINFDCVNVLVTA